MKRIDNLTGVRAFAALWVVIYHTSGDVNFHAASPIVNRGWMGVDIFYVLSGLVLSLVYVRKLPAKFDWRWYRNFLSRRIAKIYPLHLITFALSAALVVVASHFHYEARNQNENTLWSAICNVLLLHSLGLTRLTGWNAPSWSVSAEWVAYSVMFAPMVFVLRRVRTAYVAILTAILWISLILLITLVLHCSLADLTTDGVLRIIPEFVGGYLLFRLVGTDGWKRGDLLTVAGIALVLLVASFGRSGGWMLLPAVMILLAGLYAGGKISDTLFGNRLMIMLGDASYSIYLVQNLVFIGMHLVLRRRHIAENVPIALLESAIVVMTGVVTFRYVEEPLRQRLLTVFKAKAPSDQKASLVHPKPAALDGAESNASANAAIPK